MGWCPILGVLPACNSDQQKEVTGEWSGPCYSSKESTSKLQDEEKLMNTIQEKDQVYQVKNNQRGMISFWHQALQMNRTHSRKVRIIKPSLRPKTISYPRHTIFCPEKISVLWKMKHDYSLWNVRVLKHQCKNSSCSNVCKTKFCWQDCFSLIAAVFHLME